MNLPSLIFAEAAVKSSRAGYVSIFDPKAEVTTGGLKKFYADPEKMAEAVKAFKSIGFSVFDADRICISIAASPSLFNKVLGVTITTENEKNNSSPIISCKGSRQPGIIGSENMVPEAFQSFLTQIMQERNLEKLANSQQVNMTIQRVTNTVKYLRETLAGIALTQPMKPFCRVPEMPDPKLKKANELILADLWNRLGGNKLDRKENNGDGVEVVVIDTGCYTEHDFFKQIGSTIYVTLPKFLETLMEKKINEEDEALKKIDELSFDDLLTDLESVAQLDETDSEKHQEALLTKKFLREYTKKSQDPDGHGTSMVANVLAVAPKATINVIKVPTPAYANVKAWNFIESNIISAKLLGSKKMVLSCSLGPTGEVNDQELSKIDLISERVPAAIAVGNVDEDTNPNLYALREKVIAVGGAYRDSKNELSVSEYALSGNAGDRSAPDICGWFGPDGIIVPIDPDSRNNKQGSMPNEWSLSTGGTSAATAQVAGLCAIIEQVCPGIRPEVVKRVIMKTADIVPNGQNAQKIAAPVAAGSGLINIDLAVETSRVLIAQLPLLRQRVKATGHSVDEVVDQFIETAMERARKKLGVA